MASDYKFVLDNGCIFYVCAENRKEAIKMFLDEHGMNGDFFRKHCVVTNMGRVRNAAY